MNKSLDKLQKSYFKNINTISTLLEEATEIQKGMFYSLLLDIRKATEIDDLTELACQMDDLLDYISLDKANKDMFGDC